MVSNGISELKGTASVRAQPFSLGFALSHRTRLNSDKCIEISLEDVWFHQPACRAVGSKSKAPPGDNGALKAWQTSRGGRAPAKFRHPTGVLINRSEKFSWACPLRHTGVLALNGQGGPGEFSPEPPHPAPNLELELMRRLLDQLGQLLAAIEHVGLHGRGRNAKDGRAIIDRLLVVVD